MRKVTQVFTVLAWAALLLGTATAGTSTNRVLFIGNSFTYYNDMPNMFGTIAANRGHTVEVAQSTEGGYFLSYHVADSNTLALIDQGDWDFVVLQDQSTWPSACAVYPDVMDSETSVVEILYDRVKATSPNASIVLFETWAWDEGRIISNYNQDTNSVMGPDAATMQARTSYTYHYLADYLRGVGKNDVRVAHVGDAREVNRLGQNYNMFHDVSHPNAAGSYLAALVFYSTIFEADPLEVTYNRLSATDSAYVRSMARYSAYISAPNPPRNPTASVTDTNQVIGWDEPIFAQMTGTNGLATGYVVERALTSGGPYAVVGTVATNQFSDTDISADGPYYYVISATNSSGTSPVSKELLVVRTAPATPTGLVAQGGHAKVWLTWNAVPGADGYAIKRATSSGGPYTNAATGTTGTNYVDTGLIDNTDYYYVVSATNAYGASLDSTEASATTVAPALVAHYAMDGDVTDSSGNNLDATVTGAPTYVPGHSGQAIALNGSSDYAQAPAGIADSDDITISAWVYWDGDSNWQRIFDFGNDTSHYMFLSPKSGNGTLRFAIKNGGSEQIVDTTALATGVWTHVAVTLEQDISTLYINGAAVSANTAVTINPSDFNPVVNYIGKSQWPDPLFNGRIDDFRVYNGALSAAEVNSLIGSATEAYWNFEEGTADAYVTGPATDGTYIGSILDVSGNGNNLSPWAANWEWYRADAAAAATPQNEVANHLSVQNANNNNAMSAIGTSLTTWNPSAWTIEAAFKTDRTTGTQTIVGRDSQGAYAGDTRVSALYFSVRGSAMAIQFTDTAGNNWNVASAAGVVAAGNWYAVAATSDGSTLSLYLKNVTAGDASYTLLGSLNISSSANPALSVGAGDGADWDAGVFSVGRGLYNGGHADRFFGYLDDIRLSAKALNPDEFLYNTPTAPSSPTGLNATGGDGNVALDWADNAEPDLASYNVYRSTTSGSYGPALAIGIAGSSYTDNTVGNGTTYYYVVTAVDTDANESGFSSEANAVPSIAIAPGEYAISESAISSGTNLALTVSSSVPGHLYRVLATDSLVTPDWQPAGTALAGNGTNLLFSIPVAPSQTNRFFKLNVQRQ